MKKQAGFTLIEIAIVLVIIGLLLGGVLKGQEMMSNAKIKRTSNDYNGVAAAIYSYLDRYSAFPGDDPNAAARWGGAVQSGNGNGLIGGAAFSGNANTESRQLWEHLRQSGLVAGTGSNLPNHAFGGRIGVEDTIYGINGNVICMQDIQGKVGDILDRQLDDGDGNGGEFQNSSNTTTYNLDANYTLCKKL
ncbi:hypothetical protein MNBD_GAMMA11-2305 [hydrothermal vent metagenome]|uniref:Uncharacterized protein n=1 Tax=hydrothermal vent metagenome TaxID=652676 RepID=A0A3B0Y461_9ZZZZ